MTFKFEPSHSKMATRKIRAMRRAAGALSKYNIGGIEKRGAHKPKQITLPSLETARRLTKDDA